jgi:hypothetical protein
MKPDDRVQFAAVVIDDVYGIVDCFGFNDISKFEADAIIERFYRGEEVEEVPPETLKWFLEDAEKLGVMPYEYICWRNILADIEAKKPNWQEARADLDFMNRWFVEGEWVVNGQDLEEAVEQMLTRLDRKLWLGRIEKAQLLSGANIDRHECLKNIVRRSIYEYYMRLGDLEMIEKIEKLWVENV